MRLLERRKSYFRERRRSLKALGILLATLTMFMVFAIGCADNPNEYNPIDPTSCDLHHIEVLPSIASLEIGDTLSFECIAYTSDNEEIYQQIEMQWISSSPALHIDQFNGFTRLMTELPDDVTLTVKAYNCEGEEYIGTAVVRMAGPK